ncbi:MAG: hypothetical protein KC657_39615 [Myxococcales bacterium]|nr:hypothetical protein [Myxococcales bacterium]
MNPSIVSSAKLVIASDKNRALALVAAAALAFVSGCAADDVSEEPVDAQDEVSITGEQAEGPQPDPFDPSKDIHAIRRGALVRHGVDATPDARSGARGALCPPSTVLEGGRCFPLCPDGTVADGPVCWKPCPVTHPTSCRGVCTAALECPASLSLEQVKEVTLAR